MKDNAGTKIFGMEIYIGSYGWSFLRNGDLHRCEISLLEKDDVKLGYSVKMYKGLQKSFDDTMKEAQKTVDAIMEAYNADPSEDTFAELANQYNGTSTGGGLQEGVVMGTLSNYTLEQYLFDEAARQPGDGQSTNSRLAAGL